MRSDVIKRNSYLLEPGYIFCATEPASVHAVLGSCVAVCIWDRKLKYGGINHFLLPSTSSKEEATARYGNVATLGLLNMMEKSGSRPHNLLAQILGGASPLTNRGNRIGAKNAEVARAVLQRKGIVVCSEDVGGHMGRKVVFDTVTGQVMVLKVFELRDHDWIEGKRPI